jgi:DNA-binding MarR family transcriptional regulator
MQALTLTHLIIMPTEIQSAVAPASQPIDADINDTLLIEAAQLYARPQFDAALRAYTSSLSHFRESNRMLTKLVSREGRFRVLSWLLYLDADRERFGALGGATYGRLHDICTQRGINSRVLKTMLTLLRFTGFVDVQRDPNDRRVTYYHSTPRMRDFARARLGHTAAALDLLEPAMGRARALREEAGFLDCFLITSGRATTEERPIVDRMPDFMAFYATRDGSAAIVFAIMLAHFAGATAPTRAKIAKRYGLSITQVANVITKGVTLGYFTLDDAAMPAATAKLDDDYRRWISIELAFFARHMQPQATGALTSR